MGTPVCPRGTFFRSDNLKNRTPHSTQRNGRTHRADKIVRSTAARLLDRRIRRLEHDGHCMATILPPTRVAKWHKWRLVPNVSNAMLPWVAGKNLKARRENHLVLPWVLFDLRCERDLQIAAMNHPNRDLLNADSSRKRQGVYPPQKKKRTPGENRHHFRSSPTLRRQRNAPCETRGHPAILTEHDRTEDDNRSATQSRQLARSQTTSHESPCLRT